MAVKKEIGSGTCSWCPAPFTRRTSMGSWAFNPQTGGWVCPVCHRKRKALARLRRTDRKKYMIALSCTCGALDNTYEEVRPHAKECGVR